MEAGRGVDAQVNEIQAVHKPLEAKNSQSGVPAGLIDFHCHILPGIDDGPGSASESLKIARTLELAGFAEVYCTPHCIKGVWENTPAIVRRAVRDLQVLLDEAGILLKLRPGMEYYLDEFFPQFLTDPQTLGDSDYILVESPSRGIPDLIKENIFAAIRAGLKPVLAHPERHAMFAPQKEGSGVLFRVKRLLTRHRPVDAHYPAKPLLFALSDMGCCFQGNLGSFAGRYGKDVQQVGKQLLALGMYTHFGSDAHQPAGLSSMLEKGLIIADSEGAEGCPALFAAG
ncbi:phosphoesterase [Desulfuromonas versatilis]|uniref:protein-tyrosine-phosphatase n=2 Tax=Desulfuromonas versatilis TaxID=2802975 RepID=A0ABN6DZ92_9BACT|nr:phosphoesterase [Desulfuromonas versatilis]